MEMSGKGYLFLTVILNEEKPCRGGRGANATSCQCLIDEFLHRIQVELSEYKWPQGGDLPSRR